MSADVCARPIGEARAYRLVGDGADVAEANAFLRSVELRGLSPRTVRAYAMDLVQLLRWLRGQALKVHELTEARLLEFIGIQRAKEAKPRSINRRLCTARLLHLFVTGEPMARGRGVSTSAPYFQGRGREHSLGLHSIRPSRRQPLRVKVPRTLIEPLGRETVRDFLETCHWYRDLAVVHLMLLCGLRSHEVLSLRLEDVSSEDDRVRVRGKGGKERTLPMPKLLLQLMHDYLQLERPETSKSERLFLVLKGPGRGSPMTAAGLRTLFRYRRRVPELTSANAHRFRHTFGTDMARAGIRLHVLQRMMGHAHAETTLQYVNLSMADVHVEYRRAMARIQRKYKGVEP
ncbi:tyrosine-type recombinase/integrase [Corallococcus exiguus]|uniref:tyrosine-type recombinase/integrase n=1 Tax=Corallococcus exiguus TaxID=83462 RepID=UPI0014947435|nr:tyrosine-type recombinase/integrase [Corallococcus exiguus]NPC74224.1 tyrosine-type recombinase/integrase [Corallococcus exiguus]